MVEFEKFRVLRIGDTGFQKPFSQSRFEQLEDKYTQRKVAAKMRMWDGVGDLVCGGELGRLVDVLPASITVVRLVWEVSK